MTSKRAAALAVYVVLWLAGDVASTRYAQGMGLSVWDIRAALDVLLFLAFGWKWWPLPVALTAFRVAVEPQGLTAGLVPNVLASIPYELTLAAITKLAQDTVRIRFPLRALRDIGWFIGLFSLAAPIVANLLLLVTFRIAGAQLHFLSDLLQGAIADATSISVLVPVATVLFAWNETLVPDEPRASRRARSTLAIQTGVVVAVVVVEYALGTRAGLPLVEFSFLPLAWMSITSGVRGAALAILACDVTATLMHIALHIPIASQIEYQGFLIASALMAILLGAVSTERAGFLEGLKRAAYYDATTGLPNRLWLNRLLDAQRDKPLVLLLVELSDIRLLNEAIGRSSSEELLGGFGQRLRDGLTERYVVARTGYDEFAIVRKGETDPAAAMQEARRLLNEPFHIQGAPVFINATIGAFGIERSGGAVESFRQVDLALRRARERAERSSSYTSSPEHDERPLPIVDLHRAAESGELVSFFQPIYRFDVREGQWRLIGAESLLRWRHPQRGLLLPAEFLALLERFSLGSRVGWQQLSENLRIVARWRTVVPDFQLWSNLFPLQILDARCAQIIGDMLDSAGLPPRSLVVEVTESLVAGDDAAVVKSAAGLRDVGVAIAIDDFGTGGSSLSRLRELPVDLLKIDRSFVTRTEFDEKARTVATAIVRLASDLGVETLAEGIESAGQLRAMLGTGCRLGQGYAFAHPAPAEVFETDILHEKRRA